MKDIYDERHFFEGEDWSNHRTKRRCSYELTRHAVKIEGWIAGVAAVAAVGVSAYSAYSSSSAKDAAANVAVPTYKPYQPVLAQYNPNAGIQGLQNAYNQYGGEANRIASGENSYYQQAINATAPGALQGVRNATKVANQEINGQIPTDVTDATNRAAAQSALTGGFGSDSGQGRNLVARDLGLTSLQLQQQGIGNLATTTNLARSLNPYSAGDILGTSQSYLNNYNNNQQFNAQQAQQAAHDNSLGFNAQQQQQYQQRVNQALAPDPTTSAALAGIGTAASLYGGNYGGLASGVANYGMQPGTTSYTNTPYGQSLGLSGGGGSIG